MRPESFHPAWKVDLTRVRAKRLYFREDEISDLEQVTVMQLLKADFGH